MGGRDRFSFVESGEGEIATSQLWKRGKLCHGVCKQGMVTASTSLYTIAHEGQGMAKEWGRYEKKWVRPTCYPHPANHTSQGV